MATPGLVPRLVRGSEYSLEDKHQWPPPFQKAFISEHVLSVSIEYLVYPSIVYCILTTFSKARLDVFVF